MLLLLALLTAAPLPPTAKAQDLSALTDEKPWRDVGQPERDVQEPWRDWNPLQRPRGFEEPARPESPRVAAPSSALEARLFVGARRGAYTENIGNAATQTSGVWSLPVGGAELRERLEGDRWLAGRFEMNGAPPLNGVNFPLGYAITARAERRGLLPSAKEVGFFLAAQFERFSQVTVSYFPPTQNAFFVARTNTLFWLELGAADELDWVGHWLELAAGFLFSPYGWSSANGQQAQTVRGVGLELRGAAGITEHLYAEVPFRLISLSVGVPLTGTAVGLNLGWRF